VGLRVHGRDLVDLRELVHHRRRNPDAQQLDAGLVAREPVEHGPVRGLYSVADDLDPASRLLRVGRVAGVPDLDIDLDRAVIRADGVQALTQTGRHAVLRTVEADLVDGVEQVSIEQAALC